MVQRLWLATLVVIAGGAWMAYSRTRDPFHPAVVVAGPLAFVYGVWPFWLNTDSGLETLFGSEPLTEVAFLYLAALTAFFLGLLRLPNARTLYWMRRYAQLRTNPFNLELSPAARKRLFVAALILGALALAAYIQMISNVGGFVSAYSRAKGGGYSYSGYVGEAVLLAFPAIILLALSRQGTGRVRAIDILMALIIASPQLIQGTLGGRRGPIFLSIMVLFLAWFLARGRIPKLRTLMIGVGVAGFAVLFVMSQRGYLYLGSGGEVDLSRMESIFTPSTLEANDYVAGAATVLTDRYYDDYSWGAPHIITLLVRPIPRQIWPNKYQFAEALLGYKTVSGGDWGHYVMAIGFAPPTGSAVGFIANLHGDFSWGVVIALFLLGWGFALLWKRHRLRGGLWSLLFVEAMILSIYLPTQSFSAFYHRFLIMAAVSIIAWKLWMKKQ
jgi:oligosaccharide repeat unit polymerase